MKFVLVVISLKIFCSSLILPGEKENENLKSQLARNSGLDPVTRTFLAQSVSEANKSLAKVIDQVSIIKSFSGQKQAEKLKPKNQETIE